MEKKNIKSFAANQNYLYCIDVNNNISITDTFLNNTIDFQVNIELQEIYALGEFFWTNSIDGNGYYYVLDKFNSVDFFVKRICNKAIYGSINGKTRKLDFFGNLIWEIDDKVFTFSIIHNRVVYKKNGCTILSIDDLNGNFLWSSCFLDIYNWEFDGNKTQAEVKKIIGEYKGILWITLNSGRLLGLNIENGELVYDLASPCSFPLNYNPAPENGYHWFGLHSFLDDVRGQIFGTSGNYYWEIDLEKPDSSYILYDVTETCLYHKVQPSNIGAWHGDEIYFWQGDINNRFGIFNRKLREITWSGEITEVQGKFPSIRKIDYAVGRLYVLDNNNTLHIFEI